MKYSIRPCRNLRDLAACVQIQKHIWGYADAELYPQRLFVTLNRIGGHVLGVFTSKGKLVGFVASIPAWRNGRKYFHSLSLGVLPEHEGRGLGRALKLEQRRAALRAGVGLVEWTFDPLRAKNAFFNIGRLGAIARRYLPDHYGYVESRLQRGLPSDRLVAEWWLKSPRVRRALGGRDPRTSRPPAAEVAISGEIDKLVERDPEQACAIQRQVRDRLLGYFRRRWVITGFVRDERGTRYVLDVPSAAGIPRQTL